MFMHLISCCQCSNMVVLCLIKKAKYRKMVTMYEGRSLNKLQNDVILLIFQTCKFGNIQFIWNLIGDIYWNFYDDDVIMVTSVVLRTQPFSAVFFPAVFFYNSPSLKQQRKGTTSSISKHV